LFQGILRVPHLLEISGDAEVNENTVVFHLERGMSARPRVVVQVLGIEFGDPTKLQVYPVEGQK
jgi:hypothetical protein